MDQTARFALPQLAPGQMQKEFFHNEALQRIDMLLCPVVEGSPAQSPPASPIAGSCYLVATGATGEWSGEDDALACFTDGGWRFVTPVEGMRVLDRSNGQLTVRTASAWESGVVRAAEVRIGGQVVLGQRQPAITSPTGGTIVDDECRVALVAALSAMRNHGLIA